MVTGVPGGRARSALAAGPGARFADVRWVAETGSTNTDVMELARQGEPEGVVVVADHQGAGRGRAGRTWSAPPGASLLLSILLRPRASVADRCTMAVAVAAAEAVEAVAGFSPRLKWPNDLVVPGDDTGPDRKLAGILAEADWAIGSSAASGPRQPGPDERVVVVVGLGVNVAWPAELPDDLAGIAVACNHVTGRTVDREDLLISLLGQLGRWYDQLEQGESASLLAEWRARSATLGRRVRVELGREDVVGRATDLDEHGHLVVLTDAGEERTLAVGDVVHLRSIGPA
jgi:BirA family biotin operon repressor/biotin-[acetyl-CoA-carboxylase] ligase